jgi:DNA-binding NarL/FixJ family response regulator
MIPGPIASDRWALVVEDHADTRAWLVEALESAFPGERALAVGSLAEADKVLAEAPPARLQRLHLALIDLGLPDGSGVELIGRLAERLPHVLPVVATVHDDDEHLFDAIAGGAQGYLLKHDDTNALVQRLRRIDDGEPPLSPSVARRIVEHFRQRPPQDLQPAPATAPSAPAAAPAEMIALTAREAEVLALLGRGSRVAEAANRLGLTEQTVATYVKLIYRKLRISSRAEAALAAAQRGLV